MLHRLEEGSSSLESLEPMSHWAGTVGDQLQNGSRKGHYKMSHISLEGYLALVSKAIL